MGIFRGVLLSEIPVKALYYSTAILFRRTIQAILKSTANKSIVLKWIVNRLGARLWTQSYFLRIKPTGGLICISWLHKRQKFCDLLDNYQFTMYDPVLSNCCSLSEQLLFQSYEISDTNIIYNFIRYVARQIYHSGLSTKA